MRKAHANEYYTAIVEDDDIVRLVRSPTPIEDFDHFQERLAELVTWLEDNTTARRGCLVDSRESIPRNDAQFEDILRTYRKMVRDRFERSAVLLRTQVGALQTRRFDREEGTNTAVFHDEAEAMAWLRSAD